MKSKNFVKKSIAFLTILFTFLPSSFPKAGLIIEPTCNDECSYYGQPCSNGGTCGNYDSDPCLECPTITPPSCTNECSYIGQRSCYNSNYYQVCGNYDSDSCLEWSAPQYCGAGYTCQSGSCVPSTTCTDECSYYGQKICAGSNSYKVCGNYDSDSCLEWSSIQYCPSGYICQNGECVYQPPSCQDECSYYGQTEKRCSENYVQQRTCGSYDSDSCLEWSGWQNVENCDSRDGCQGTTYYDYYCDCGSCKYTTYPNDSRCITCQNECSFLGQRDVRCNGRYLQERTCGNYDTDSCLEWSSWTTIQDCGTSNWTSEYRCSGNWVQRKYINRGCSNSQCFANEEWRNWEDCSAQGKICQNGQCVISCQNECSLGQREYRCSGNYVQKRTCGNYDFDPCLEWSNWENETYCGESGWTSNYRCSSSRYLEREYVQRGCSNAQCYANSEWRQVQDCGTSGWTDEYQCSSSRYLLRKWIERGCSNNQCFNYSEWRQIQDCGTDSWTDNYRCSGNWVQREKIEKGCSNNACYQRSNWINVENCDLRDGCQGTTYYDYYCDCGSCKYTTYPNDSRCITCQCTNWSDWQDRGCGQGGCAQNQMWQERVRTCTPPGCDRESETRCVQDPRCEPNDPARGTLTVSSSTEPCAGQYVTFTISAQDLQGVEKVCLNDDCQSCAFQSSCTKTWQTKKDIPGTYTFSGKIYGKKPDGSQEIVFTNPSSISVTWKDCNRPPIANAGPDKEVLETQSIVLEGSGSDPDSDPITFSWTCSGGTLSNSNIAQPTFTAPAVDSDTQIVCTLTVRDSKGAQSSDSMQILVKAQTLSVTLEAIPATGSAPLIGVDLKATVSGTAIGPINYKFDCTSDGTWEYEFSGISDNPKIVVDACNYQTGGTYNAKVYVERGAAPPAWAQATILVSSPYPVVDLKVNGSDGPITIPYNSSVTLSWTSNNVNSCYASGDWSGSKPISGTETISGILSQKTFTITCSGSGGSASDNVVVYVSLPSFSVSLFANPSSGCAPLNNVSLTANVSRDFSGNLTYYFDCTSDGSFELIQTTSQNSFTASNLCSFPNIGTFFAKVRVEGAGMSREASVPINVYSCYQPPTYPAPSVDLKVNGQDGLITVLSGSSITLSWTSANANYCTASGNWSGTKSISGSETISNITSTKIFTLTCYGPGGSAADSVTVNVSAPGVFTVYKTVRNLSKGTGFEKSINVEPGEVLVFAISVKAGENPVSNLLVQDILPDKIIYRGDLKINNVSVAGDILTGLNIGNLAPNETKLITFKADVASKENFPFGQTKLKNKVLVSSSQTSLSDEAEIIVSKTAVAGAVTGIPTGLTNNLLFDSFILPLILALTLVWLFKSRIIQFERWIDERKRNFQEYKAQKLLQAKIAQLRLKEFFKK